MNNPYRPPETQAKPNSKLLGAFIGIVTLAVSAAPTCYLIFLMVRMYVDISAMESPPQNMRPVASMIAGAKWSAIGLVALTPISLVASMLPNRLGSSLGKECAIVGTGLFPFPFAVGFFGPMVVIVLTGAGYGT